MSYPRTEGERRRRNKILPYSRAPVSVKRLIDSGLPHHELAPHPGAQEVSDERTADRETDERTQVAANQSIRRISDQIHDEENQRQLMPHLARVHKPQADSAHAAATVDIRATAQTPMPPNATPASGLRRHIGSQALPGVRSATQLTPATTAPSAKKPLRATRPAGGRDLRDEMGRSVLLSNESRLGCGRNASRPKEVEQL